MNQVYVALGANLGDPLRQIVSAVLQIQQQSRLEHLRLSPLYWSAPLGPAGQPPYVNAVLAARCALSPLDLLHYLQELELAHGRRRDGERWGPRSLDLDLLLYDQQQIQSLELMLPHPHIKERSFVLQPLHAIAPDLHIPGQGMLEQLLTQVDCSDLKEIAMPAELRHLMK